VSIDLLIDIALLGLLVTTALGIARTSDLFAAVMLSGIYGLLSASFFVDLDAVDVAFTEAAVGAGIAPLLMFVTLSMTGRFQREPNSLSGASLALVVAVGTLLVYASFDMPVFGAPDAPVHLHVAPRYLNDSMAEIGIPNVVTSVLASYRGYDTLGEVVVIFTAGIAVLGILHRREQSVDAELSATMKHHTVLRVVGKVLIPPILLFALYVQFHGDYGPGGGFQAGVIFAAALILYCMLFGVQLARKVVNFALVRVLAGLGVLLYGTVGVLGILTGNNYLDYDGLAADPVAGQHLGIILIELGVGTTVAAVMLLLYFTFAERVPADGKD
jgi:multicomponent Na+:H+ antiporter subunit B